MSFAFVYFCFDITVFLLVINGHLSPPFSLMFTYIYSFEIIFRLNIEILTLNI